LTYYDPSEEYDFGELPSVKPEQVASRCSLMILINLHPERAIRTVALLVFAACTSPRERPSPVTNQSASLAADHAELLRLHERARTAHLQRRADWLVSEWADTMFSLSRGGVSVGTMANRERGRARFQEYLDASTFQAWDDIAPPRIRISPDGQMAYVIVQKRVHLTAKDSTGATVPERTRYAWMTVYEKKGGRWKLAAIASTDRPDTGSAGEKEE
jgi:ketosteroid isomerase-like protein